MATMRFPAYVVNAKADFAKRQLRITISTGLDEEAVRLRGQLGGWIVNDVPVNVTLESMQPHLPEMQPGVEAEIRKALAGTGGELHVDEDGVIHAGPPPKDEQERTPEEIRAELA